MCTFFSKHQKPNMQIKVNITVLQYNRQIIFLPANPSSLKIDTEEYFLFSVFTKFSIKMKPMKSSCLFNK